MPFLGIALKEKKSVSSKNILTLTFMVIWCNQDCEQKQKQCVCQQLRIKKMWLSIVIKMQLCYAHIHTPTYFIRPLKKGNPAICDNMNELWEHCAKWNKLETKLKFFIILFICGTQKSQTHRTRMNKYKVITRGCSWGKLDTVQWGQTSSCNMINF